MHISKRARMDNYDEGVSSSSQNGDIFESDDEKEKNIAVKKRATAKKMRTARKMTAKRKAKTENTNPAKMERTTTPGKR
jgi:hypothetical protein